MPQLPMVTTDSYAPDRLVAGETQLVTRSYTLAGGQSLRRGTVVGQVAASGKVTLCTAAAADGSQVPFGVLADDYDATAGDTPFCAIHLAGEFNPVAMAFGAGHTADSTRAALRDAGIYLKPVLTAAGANAG